jgi:hypothetical protein
MECNRQKAIHALETNVLRYGKVIQDSLRLLRSAREDGGLTKVQSDALDKLIAQSEAVVTGQDESLYGLSKDERREVTDFLKTKLLDFVEHLEKPERGTLIIRRLGQTCG